MDLLYSRYTNPLEFMRLYIEQGRFGEFVAEIVTAENKRKKEQAEKEEEDKMWMAYVRVAPDKTFSDWKAEFLAPSPSSPSRPAARPGKRDEDMTQKDIADLMNRLFPS